MRHVPRRLLVSFVAAALAACQAASNTPPPAAAAAVDTAAVVAGLNDLWATWATADTSENLDGIVALLADNIVLDARGMPRLRGRDAIKAAFAPVYKQVDYREAFITPTGTTAVSNTLALQTGQVVERYVERGKKAEMTDYGRYAASFAKGPDGWRMTYGMSFVDSTVTKK